MRVAYIAEITGKAGIAAVKQRLRTLRVDWQLDFVIAGADGATNGHGLGRNHAGYLRKLGVDVLSMGECAFYKKDLVESMPKLPYVVRPLNISPWAPGTGSRVYRVGTEKLGVAVIIGQSGFSRMQGDSPAVAAMEAVERLRRETPCVLIDIHAQATAEKMALYRLLDGRCSAIVGSHTRVQTADAQIGPGGTGFICDAGRTGSQDSVGGSDPVSRIAEYRTGIQDWTREAWANPELQGVVVEIDKSGRAVSMESFKLACTECVNEGSGESGED